MPRAALHRCAVALELKNTWRLTYLNDDSSNRFTLHYDNLLTLNRIIHVPFSFREDHFRSVRVVNYYFGTGGLGGISCSSSSSRSGTDRAVTKLSIAQLQGIGTGWSTEIPNYDPRVTWRRFACSVECWQMHSVVLRRDSGKSRRSHAGGFSAGDEVLVSVGARLCCFGA